MTDVELNLKDYKRLLSILSDYFGEKKLKGEDTKLRNKIEVLHDAEVQLEIDDKEFSDKFK